MSKTICFNSVATSLLVLLLCAPSGAADRNHPLTPALNLARATHEYVQNHVADFTCILVKRERVDGFLLRHQYLQMKVRHENVSDRGVVTPYSVYIRYLRQKIEDNPDKPRYIRTRWRMGYYFATDAEAAAEPDPIRRGEVAGQVPLSADPTEPIVIG